jgi:CheY-like chemotaxis protein
VLRDRGYQVHVAAGASEALELAEALADRLDLLVTDVVMPHGGGGELAARLLARRPALRVLFMSGYTDDRLVLSGVADDHHAFLPKPFTPSALAAKVREVLDSPRWGEGSEG